MAADDAATAWKKRSEECLLGAKDEFAQARYNNAAARSYWAAYHAAIMLLTHENVDPDREMWRHEDVWRDFDALVGRKAEFSNLVGALSFLNEHRVRADYTRGGASLVDAEEALRRAGEMVSAVMGWVEVSSARARPVEEETTEV